MAVVFNRDYEGAEADPENRAREDILNVAQEVTTVLREAGYNVAEVGIREDVHRDLKTVMAHKPVAVINLCESLRGDNRFEALVPMLLEFEGLAFTGSPPASLLQALHKDRAKRLLLGSGVSTPAAFVIETLADVERLHPRFPLIVKPTREDASVGIARQSVVRDRAALRERVGHVLEHYRQPALVEEFIEGREINVSILERVDGPPEVLPLHEIDFSGMPADRPKIVSFEGKWVESSPEYHGTKPVPCQLPSPELQARVEKTALAAFRALDLRDYGRVDLRLAADGTPFVIDVNPNCDLSAQGGGFSRAARASGMTYRDLVLRLLALAMNRRPDADTIPLAIRSRRRRGDSGSQSGQEARQQNGQPVSAGGSGVRHRAARRRVGSA